jgi:hypothetical protein
LLQCGVVRIELMFMDYTRMLQAVIHEFSQEMGTELLQRVVAGRSAELFKILAYATYLNPYLATISNAWSALKVIPLRKNRLQFAGLYLFPALTPIFVRKTLLQLLGKMKPKWHEYQDFLAFLQEVKIRKKTAGVREVFNKDYLSKLDG